MTPIPDDKELDKIVEESTTNVTGKQLLNQKIENDKQNKPVIQNEGSRISLGELGSWDCVEAADIDEVFDKLDGIVFKMKKCMFRISYINKGKRSFTAQLINEAVDKKTE
jgi:hypothetical protein